MLDQFFIAAFGLLAVVLLARGRPPFTFYGCLFGLLSEPFWFYSAYKAHQLGIMLMVFVYATIYALGVIGHRPRSKA